MCIRDRHHSIFAGAAEQRFERSDPTFEKNSPSEIHRYSESQGAGSESGTPNWCQISCSRECKRTFGSFVFNAGSPGDQIAELSVEFVGLCEEDVSITFRIDTTAIDTPDRMIT